MSIMFRIILLAMQLYNVHLSYSKDITAWIWMVFSSKVIQNKGITTYLNHLLNTHMKMWMPKCLN